ncbi:bifunctional folylpolyglutamate synthase/dihydrofolate synthase [bacterium]|nr:MAG: bifunctional folylpolyglutamate synthase/dihydrofolate synthase [bacterium]
MEFAEAKAWLDGRQETRWKLGLTRMEAVLAAVGDPHVGLPAVHVAGTNGKGSFCAMLEAALRGAGLKTGLTTSPHLHTPLERIRVDGKPVSGADFARHLARLKRTEPEEATYFELVTAAAFMQFRQERVDVAVVETGLGGALDATNVLPEPLLTVVTSIAYDHQQHLGDTLELIAGEKAGILKPGAPFLCGEDDPAPLRVLAARARKVGARMRGAPAPLARLREDWERGTQEAATVGGTRVRVPLLGDAALKNAALVVAALEELNGRRLSFDRAAALKGLSTAVWPCRFQVLPLGGGRRVVLDGAHNEAAMTAFADTWSRSPFSGQDPLIVMGVLADKDWERLADLAAPLAGRFIATAPPSPRALDAGRLAEALRRRGAREVRVEPNPVAAVAALAEDSAPAGAVVGSFYLAGFALGELSRVPA